MFSARPEFHSEIANRIERHNEMPELPEVETMRRGILGAVGARIESVERPICRLKPIVIRPRLPTLRRRVVAKTVQSVDRVGKRVVVRLDSQDALVFEPRMTGLVLVAQPPDQQHMRICLKLSGGAIDQFCYWDRRGLGSVQLLSPKTLAQRLGPAYLGPDALALTSDQLRLRLRRSKRRIKTALLDQRAVAGIGNLYASEILHAARIHPQLRCDRLTCDQWRCLHDSMAIILKRAIRYEGSTLADGTYRNALNQSGRYQKHHRVYGRGGKYCLTCRQDFVKRIVQNQRSTFFCPSCQSRRRPLR